MKMYILISLIFCSQNLFSQTINQKPVDTSSIYIKFISSHYKPKITTVYVGSMPKSTLFSRTIDIPSTEFMWFRCDSAPCLVAVDYYTYPDKPFDVDGQFNSGDSIVYDMDARTTKVINRKK